MKSVCPGCNFGCGLYLQPKDEEMIALDYRRGILEVDFKKGSEVNEGKLCKFGVELPEYYANKAVSKVDGSEVEFEKAVEEAGKRLAGKDAVFLSFGDSTCEELIALSKLADGKIESGLGALSDIDETAYMCMAVGIPYEDIEKANSIVLINVDPYAQYPLILRRILRAKENGCKVAYVGWRKPRNLADKVILLSPSTWIKTLAELENELSEFLGEGCVVISDLHPHVHPAQVKTALNLGKGNVLFLKPFANLTGLMLLKSSVSDDRTLDNLISEIEEGNVKALFVHEADLIEVMPDSERVKEALQKLEVLVVQTSRASPITEMAHVVIAPEQLWEKKGVVVNNEGRILEVGGERTDGFEALCKVAEALGKEKIEFDDAHKQVLEKVGVDVVNEYTVPAYERKEYPAQSIEAQESDIETALVKVYTPFTWRDMEGQYICLSINTIASKGIMKGNLVTVGANGNEGRYPFRPDDVADDVVLTFGRIDIAKENITPLEKIENTIWTEEKEE
jgi:predicted molibdopterin-dependent oxidoreductase YjgC